MMVLRDGTNSNIFPADRCTWAEDASYTGSGYRITGATFFPGASINNVLGVTTATTQVSISSPILGYIGKSGRFVAISN